MDACWPTCCRCTVVKREKLSIEAGVEIAGDTWEREGKAVGIGTEVIHVIY